MWFPDERDDRSANRWHSMGKKNTGDSSAVGAKLKLRTKGRKLKSELLLKRLASDFDLEKKVSRKKLFPALSSL